MGKKNNSTVNKFIALSDAEKERVFQEIEVGNPREKR